MDAEQLPDLSPRQYSAIGLRHGYSAAGAASDHVAVLLCTCNGEAWLQPQLDSLLAQDHGDWSLWVSDDGSTDGTHEILARFGVRHPRHMGCILNGPRRGFARNYLELVCNPDLPRGYVAFSDQDDVWMPNKLSRALSRLREAGDAPCAWAARYVVTGPDLAPRYEGGAWPLGPSFGNAVVQNILSGHTLTLNAAALDLVRLAGVQDVPHHDWWIYLLMTAVGAGIIADEEAVLYYRQHEDNTIGVRSTMAGRFRRLGMLLRGDMGRWVETNLRALAGVEEMILPDASAFSHRWLSASPSEKMHLMRDFSIHRQSWLETMLIRLAVWLDRA